MNRFISILSLLALSSLLLFSFSKDQTVKIYLAGDNSDNSIKIIEGEYGISEIYFFKKKDNIWLRTEILSIDTIQEYVKVKPNGTSQTFELFVDWVNGKITVVDNNKTKVIYWLKNSQTK